MRDPATGRPVPDDQARLAAAGDGSGEELEADPQARDEKPITVGSEEHTAEPEYDNISSWVDQFKNNPLVGVPHQNFAADVTEPGAAVVVEQDDMDGDANAPNDADIPTVPEDFPDSRYAGLDLDEALEQWLGDCYIDGWDFDADFSELLEAVVLDRRGRRGTAIIEHAYDDATERRHLLGLRPIKVETVTAYTREGKNIVLRPDDQTNDFESVAIYDLGDDSREDAPRTPAGKTAAIAQYDDVFGTSERDEIPFALSDITVSAYNADTGQLFGRPDTASVADRAAAVKKKLERVDQAVLNAAFTNIIARVDSTDGEVVKKVRDNLDPNAPETVSATNAPVELTEADGGVPDAVGTIQQEIEFVLAAMPTPLYRVGFAGDINRDVTDVQQEDYRDEIRRERTRLEADFQKPIRMKAAEFLEGDPHAELPDGVDVHLEIRPPDAESPLQDDAFDADAFNTLMSGLSTAAGPKGGADAIIPRRVIVDQLLDMDADELLGEPTDVGDDTAAALEPAQTDPEVQRAFEEFTDAELSPGNETAWLEARYSEGDDGSFSDVPVIPTGIETLSDAWVRRWAEWIAAGRPEIAESEQLAEVAELDWNPSLHPRNPRTGQFVERPFDLPDDAPDFGDMSAAETLSYIDENGGDIAGTVFDPDSPVTVDGVSNDATSLDDVGDGNGDASSSSAAEFRRGIDTVETGAELSAEEVSPGDTIQVGDGRMATYVEVEEVADPEYADDLVFRGTNAAGGPSEARSSKGTIREAEPVRTPDFDLEWGDDLDARTEETLTAIEESVPTGDDAPLNYGSMPLPDDDAFDERGAEGFLDEVRPQLAAGLAAAKDGEVAEKTLGRFGQLGDNGPGADGKLRNFSGTAKVAGQGREAIKLSTLSEQTSIHEAAHNLFKAFGLRGQSNGAAHDYEGDIPDFDLTSTAGEADDIDSYSITPPDETPIDTDGDGVSFGRSEWETRVRGEVSRELSANRFSEPDDFETWATEDAAVGDMLRFDEYPLQTFDEGGPQNYRIAETLTGDEVDVVGARRGFELEGPDGETFRVGVRRGGEIKSADIHETNGFLPDVNKKRNGTPGAWGSSSPDLDEVLGNDDPSDTATERIHRVAREANAAWFKMNLINQNSGESAAEEATIGGNYSATNTHETLARLHEYMQADTSATENAQTAKSLVKHHPRLLESYRHAFDIPDQMRENINSALAGTDAEVRL